MDAAERAVLEDELRNLCDQGDHGRAATLAVRGYGPEILGFLHALHRDEDEAGEVFSQFCEDLWRGLSGFAQRASFRTWLYVLARHASHRFRRTRKRSSRVERRFADCPELEQVEQRMRTATLTFLRSQTRTRFVELRDALEEDDRALLILRVDKELDWNELARVFHDGESLDDKTLARESARLRKRFQLVKDRLRELVRRAPSES
jgi:RNA polymerase sigma-70 factor (ECF subfamily)